MRKLVIIVIGVVLVVGLAVLFLKFQKKGLAIEEVVPQEAQLYAYFDNAEDNIKEMGRSQFWQTMGQLDYKQLADKGILNPAQVLVFQEVQSKLSDPQAQMVLQKLFGKEFAVVVYPLSIKISALADLSVLATPTFLDDALSNFMIVTRIPPDVQVAESFSGLFQGFGEDTKKETLNYKDFTIHSVVFPKIILRVSYVRLKDLLVVTLGERAAQKCIDVFKKERPSLAQEGQFIEAMKRSVKDRELYLYWDMEQFLASMKDQVEGITSLVSARAQEADAAQVSAQLNQALASVSGFKTFTLSGHFDSLSKLQFNMFLDVARISPDLAAYYTCEATANRTLKLVPPGVLGYQWNSCFHLERYWDQLVAELAKRGGNDNGGGVSGQIRQMESALGFSIENDILPAFGDEFGGYLADVSVTGGFPVPKFLFFIETKDKNKVNKLLSTLTQNPFLLLQQENYADTTINYFNSPLGGEDIQPGYAYAEDYLLIAINRKILKASIDAYAGHAPSLSGDRGFKDIDHGLTEKNLSIFYVQMAIFANRLEDMIEWANGWAEGQQKQREALKSGTQQRLDIVIADIRRLQEDIQEMEKEKSSTVTVEGTQEAASLGADTKKELEQTIENKKSDLKALEEQRSEFEGLVKSYENTGLDSQKRQVFLETLVYPFLSGLSSISTFAGRTTIEGDVFESTFLFKAKD